jgi:CheY-like chemotaxis protein
MPRARLRTVIPCGSVCALNVCLKLSNMHVYVIHAGALTSRAEHVQQLRRALEAAHMSTSVVEDHDPGMLTASQLKQVVAHAPPENLAQVNACLASAPVPWQLPPVRGMHINQVSAALKHLQALQHIAQSDAGDMQVVLEDDAVPGADGASVCKRLQDMPLPSDWDIVFLGLPTPPAGDKDGTGCLRIEDIMGCIPATDSYAITPACARRLAAAFVPLRWPLHVHLSYLIHTLKLRAYALRPNLFVDGSKLGMFVSSLNPDNRLLYHSDYQLARALLETPSPLPPDKARLLEDILERSTLRDCPDFMCLRAIKQTRDGAHAAARTTYDTMLQRYLKGGALVTCDSSWLREYLRLHKHLQSQPVGSRPNTSGYCSGF